MGLFSKIRQRRARKIDEVRRTVSADAAAAGRLGASGGGSGG